MMPDDKQFYLAWGGMQSLAAYVPQGRAISQSRRQQSFARPSGTPTVFNATIPSDKSLG
jgi:hypothetical protein